jgi:hypothetical protein
MSDYLIGAIVAIFLLVATSLDVTACVNTVCDDSNEGMAKRDKPINISKKYVEMWFTCGKDRAKTHPVENLQEAAMMKQYIESYEHCSVINMYWVEANNDN